MNKNIPPGGGADTSGRPHYGTDQQAGNGQVGSLSIRIVSVVDAHFLGPWIRIHIFLTEYIQIPDIQPGGVSEVGSGSVFS